MTAPQPTPYAQPNSQLVRFPEKEITYLINSTQCRMYSFVFLFLLIQSNHKDVSEAYPNSVLLQNIWDIWSMLLGVTPLKYIYTMRCTVIDEAKRERVICIILTCNGHAEHCKSIIFMLIPVILCTQSQTSENCCSDVCQKTYYAQGRSRLNVGCKVKR